MYFHDHSLVMIANPKTASTALKRALAPKADMILQRAPQLKHCTFGSYKWYIEPFILGYTDTAPTTCGVVREPLEWLGSWYRYRQRDEIRGTPNSTYDVSFDQFIEGYLASDRPAFAAVGRQTHMFIHPDTGASVDRLFRFDAMPAYIAFLQERLKMQLDLGQVNVSPKRDLAVSPSIRARLEAECAAEFELYEQAEKG